MTAALRLCLIVALAAAKPLSFCDSLGYLAVNATHRRLGAGGRGQQHALPESRGRSKPERLPPTPGGLPRSSVPAHEARLAALEARRGGKTPREPKAGWWETTAESASANPAEHEQARDARSQPKVRAPKHAPLPKAKPATGSTDRAAPRTLARRQGAGAAAGMAEVFGEARHAPPGGSAKHGVAARGGAPVVDGVAYAWLEGTAEKRGRPRVDDRVAAATFVSAERDATWQPRPRRREALPPPDEQEDPAAALARLEALFDVDDDHDVAEAPRGPASLQEKLDVLAEAAARRADARAARHDDATRRAAALAKRSAAAWASFDAAVAAGYYDPSPPTEAFDAVLHCCAHQQLPERALNVVDDMRRNGVPRTGATYAALMKAVATAPQWHRAYRLATDDVLDAMEGDRVAPTPALYVHLIGACGRVGDAAAAGCYFDEMRDAHGFSRGASAYAAYFGALANAMTVGTKRGVKARAPHVDPWRGLGISDEEATSVQEADPAAFAAVDDLGAGFHRKRDEPAGAVVTVAEEAAEEDDDRAGVEATLAALEGDVDDATPRAARRADDDDDGSSRGGLDAFLAGLADEDLSDDDKELLAASLGGAEADLDALLAPEDELTEADLFALLEGPGDATAAEAALAAAHAARGARGVGASDAVPVVPSVLREAFDLVDFAPARKRRGPPERFLRNFRRLCRQRRVDQPPELPPDPVLWRQEGSTFRRSRRGQRDVPQKRNLLRAGRR
ncbi:hypothetical protein JL721_3117 [Aureococcus anophagefferens]|nr:hypothetical protein JL721_3117 [Aureococcus anophagefferens]